MKKNSPAFLISVIALIFTNCSPSIKMQSVNSTKGLKDYYKNHFPIGVAVTLYNLKTDEANLILQQFNSLTPENAMKMEPKHP